VLREARYFQTFFLTPGIKSRKQIFLIKKRSIICIENRSKNNTFPSCGWLFANYIICILRKNIRQEKKCFSQNLMNYFTICFCCFLHQSDCGFNHQTNDATKVFGNKKSAGGDILAIFTSVGGIKLTCLE